MSIHLDEQPEIQRVDELSSHPTDVPSDEADWASMNSSTILSLQNDHPFGESCIAFITTDEYEHGFQYATTVSLRRIREIQRDVNLLERFEPNENGVVVQTDTYSKYTLEDMIQSLFHTVITDSYLQSTGNETADDFTIEYTFDETTSWYRVLFMW